MTAGPSPGGRIPEAHRSEVSRILAVLRQPDHVLLSTGNQPRAPIVTLCNGELVRVAATSGEIVRILRKAGMIGHSGASRSVDRYEITPEGRAYLRLAGSVRASVHLPLEGAAFPSISEVRALLSGPIKAKDRHRLLEAFELLAGPDDMVDRARDWQALGLTLSADELRVLERLRRSCGRLVSPADLYRAFVIGRLSQDELPDQGLVRMVLRRLRTKLTAAGLPLIIETRRGLGSALILTAPGFVLPGAQKDHIHA